MAISTLDVCSAIWVIGLLLQVGEYGNDALGQDPAGRAGANMDSAEEHAGSPSNRVGAKSNRFRHGSVPRRANLVKPGSDPGFKWLVHRDRLSSCQSFDFRDPSLRALFPSARDVRVVRAPPKAGAEAMGLRTPESGSFRSDGRRRHVSGRDEALPGERRRRAAAAREALEWARETTAHDGRPEVLRPARHLAAHDAADRGRSTSLRSTRGSASTARRSAAGRASRSRTCCSCRTPLPRSSIRSPRRRRCRSSARSPIRSRASRTRRIRAASRGAPRSTSLDRHRRHGLHRPRVRVLHLRRGLVRARPEPLPLRGRLRRGSLELRQARARLHGPREGGLLPARAARHAARPAHAHGADARAARDPVRVPSPRGRLGRPVRDRPPLPAADAHGRSGHDLQVRRQERRPRRRQDGDVHAEADLRRQRLGHAHAPVAVEGRRRR